MNINRKTPNPTARQAGMALLLCLLFLTTLTLLGLSASADAILQNQLTANLQETERARQSAHAALSWAEEWLYGLEGLLPEPCTTTCEGVKFHATGELPPRPELEDISWWLMQGYEAGVDPLTGTRFELFSNDSASPPMWIIEVVHEIPAYPGSATEPSTDARAWYRILARGSGQTDKAISVIESTVTRSWPSDEGTTAVDKGRVSWRELR